MYKFKEKGMITKTVILGMLDESQMHGYEIKIRLKKALGETADINFGSIYYGLKSLTDKGFIDHLRDEPGKGSPERSIYRITSKGRARLKELLELSLKDTEEPLRAVEVGLHFMEHLPASKVREILLRRYEQLKVLYDEALVADSPADEPRQAAFVREYRLYQLGAQVHWLKHLLSGLEKD